MSDELLVAALDGADGAKRAAATKEAFRRGKALLPALKAAMAKPNAPAEGTIVPSRREVVRSLVEGLAPNPPKAKAGYTSNSFGLRVEAGTTAEDAAAMGKKHGFTLGGTFDADAAPNCYVMLNPGKALADVMRAVLEEEPRVVTVNLNYFLE